jgi:drug/metabolite transporter (DMT)-like permease
MKTQNKGAFYILCAAIFWSFGGVLAKSIPWSGLSIAALRGLIAAITIAAFRRSFSFKLNRSTIIAALALTMTTVLFMVATKLTTAANAIVLQYTSPFFIILMNFFVHHHKPSRRDVIALIGIGFGITLFFINQLDSGNLLGDFFGLMSGLMFAGVFFANKLEHASPFDATYMGNLFSVMLLPFVFFDSEMFVHGWLPWILILIMGVMQLGFGYIFFSLGIRLATATQSNIIATLEPILNPIWVLLVIGEVPTILSIIGGSIVLITVVLYNHFETKANFLKLKQIS